MDRLVLFDMLPRLAGANLSNSTFSYAKLFGECGKGRSVVSAGPDSRYAIGGEDMVPVNFAPTAPTSDKTWSVQWAKSYFNGVHVVFKSRGVFKINKPVVRFNAVNVVNPSFVFSVERIHDQSMDLSSDDSGFSRKGNLSVPFVGEVRGNQRSGTAMSPCNNSFDTAKVGDRISRTFLDGFPLLSTTIGFDRVDNVVSSQFDSPIVGRVYNRRTVYTSRDVDSRFKASSETEGV